MSAHVTKVVSHDHVNCHTARHMESGDCGTRFEAHCSCGWAQGAISREVADAIAVGHRGYSPDAAVIITRDIPQRGPSPLLEVQAGGGPVTIDEIVQKIYEERYQEPKDPEIAAYMRDGMIRDVVERTLELAIGGLAVDLVAARRERNAAREAVTVWLEARTVSGELAYASQAPGWDTYERAEASWNGILIKLDGWIANGKEQP